MKKTTEFTIPWIAACSMLCLGVFLVVVSAFYGSSYLAILGVALAFWGVILLYITPSKQVPLILMNAAVISATDNIEKMLAKSNLSQKGKYLPPNLIKDFESSLVFVPQSSEQPLPSLEQTSEEGLLPSSQNVMLLTPPGLGLSKLFEEQLGITFARANLNFVQKNLPNLLVEEMELAQKAELTIQNDTVILEVTGSVLKDICRGTDKLPRVHRQIGCLLSSAVACVLAKASGKVVIIENEKQTEDGETIRIEYHLEDGWSGI